uniref:Uncharacterized protein n=1 Tax=Lotharella oceanica TaxID=641309 RepID=A0A7S2XDA7_9EUKA
MPSMFREEYISHGCSELELKLRRYGGNKRHAIRLPHPATTPMDGYRYMKLVVKSCHDTPVANGSRLTLEQVEFVTRMPGEPYLVQTFRDKSGNKLPMVIYH